MVRSEQLADPFGEASHSFLDGGFAAAISCAGYELGMLVSSASAGCRGVDEFGGGGVRGWDGSRVGAGGHFGGEGVFNASKG